MKIQVKDLRHNPHRDLSKYPIDREKVESLKSSINETGFWDNILVRECSDGYELSYGHHRLIALIELEIEEIDIPVKPLDDATMLRIMANENMDQWKSNPSVIIETIRASKSFLDSELAKYDSWEEAPRGLIDSLDLDDRSKFQNIKTKGVGQTTILKFLGDPWKQNMIQDALSIINDESIDQEIVKDFQSLRSVTEFQKEVKRHNIPIKDQRKLSQEIRPIDRPIFRREIKDAVESVIINDKFASKAKKPDRKTEKIKEFGVFIAEVRNSADEFNDQLKDLNKLTDELGPESFSGNVQSKLLTLSLNNIQNQLNNFHSKF